jgi:hypothetical protein
MTGALDGNDKKAVHKMVRRLMKHGAWEQEVCEHWGHLEKLRCGVVLIEQYGSDGNVKVFVDGVQIADSFWTPMGSLGWSAKRFFERRYNAQRAQYLKDCFAEARLALLRSMGEAK